jgi:CheY-like chemotaxis protein
MTLAYAKSGRVYSEDDLIFFKEFCDHLGILLDNARLYNEIAWRDKAKDAFLASLSHELRNPLAPIKTSLELLHLHGIPQELNEEVETIEHQFDHMTRLLGDLLDVTRYTQSKISLTKKKTDLKELFRRVIRSSEPLVRKASLMLEVSYPSEPIYIEADATRIEQAIMNVVSNAIKYTQDGGKLEISLESNNKEAVIKVKDSGIGISAKNLSNIFDMYFQDDKASKRANSGLGLGLYLVREIVELHKGSVEAYSEGLGHGSEFVIRLPMSMKTVTVPAAVLPPENPKDLRVLVVDDNIPAANSLVRLLNALGTSAEAAYSGSEALLRNDIGTYDFVVLDLGMPELSGYDVVKELRDRGYEKPVIALTGYGLGEDKERALREGFNAHLTKPVGSNELRIMFESLVA